MLTGLIALDVSGWGERHVFGNASPSDPPVGIPWMSLDDIYIEPNASWSDFTGTGGGTNEKNGESGSTIAFIEESIEASNIHITVVRADFGHGKSLSARRFARNCAHELHQPGSLEASGWLPIFAACQTHLPGKHTDIPKVVRCVLREQAKALGFDKPLNHSLFAIPDGQKIVLLLDGLDEVSLSASETTALLRELDEWACDTRRVVIMTRPGALHPRDIPNGQTLRFVTLESFDDDQIGEWLKAWRPIAEEERLPLPTPESIKIAELSEAARTPILLFLIAQGWVDDDNNSRATLYEKFVTKIAQAKYDLDREHHPRVHKAAEALKKTLEDAEILCDTTEPQAMLWFLSRMAWEAFRLKQAEKPRVLDDRDVEKVLEQIIGRRPETAELEVIRLGALVVLQNSVRGAGHTLHFGHRSFMEYLAARYWVDTTCRLAQMKDRGDRQDLETELYGVNLLREEASIAFLFERLATLDDGLRTKVTTWAEDAFRDARVDFGNVRHPTGADDQRPPVRALALAVTSTLAQPDQPVTVSTPELKLLLSWFRAYCKPAFDWAAPGLSAEAIDLSDQDLAFADLRNSDLRGANFRNANLSGARLG